MRTIGTQVRGIRAPIIKSGDNLAEIVVSSLQKSWQEEGYKIKDKDVVGITESLVARAQGNYINIDDIAAEINEHFSSDSIGVVFPILSRNRFSMILKGIAGSHKKIYLQLSYPNDEVGNPLVDKNEIYRRGINPYSDTITEDEFYKYFSDYEHPFTGVNYIDLYKEIASETEIEIILSNRAEKILDYTKDVLAADIHTRKRTKEILKKKGAETVLGLDDICTEDKGKGYNEEYGLLGSNKASDVELKLFPREGQKFVDDVQARLKDITGKDVEVMIYGDGAFKDPAAKIWELADPVVSPAYTEGLEGTPSEVKLKYLADNDLKDLEGEKLLEAMKEEIKGKEDDLRANIKSQGTTPRRLTDLLGSLCDLVSGSGDKGTPIILISGYFDNLADE
ncbi:MULTISPECIES: coenzyme F420-0:L-glutamate ligase [unclassified Halanaerobium]|uniref:coenzyme F420-0:L-glutamate ligase n=1 Tax=unclassified Halanaerobium TaxID=2641197 RepID=UPI000DF2C817|nr:MULTISPECIES: coenzyme F420-0:L-glutamate ligase [unclassified Halanaerobium]RCW48691.1 F420-0:gamma-glutamyl ligase [Halanaerobium sp. MA284_MarDTE_T2]RCW86565.1 F420-0:gamma-glutamyl ligase [Halanaerobium sp. DL-01]